MSELRAPHFRRWLDSEKGRQFLESLKFSGMVLSVSRGVCDLAWDLAQREGAPQLARLAPLPSENCWIELIDFDGIPDDERGQLGAILVTPSGIVFSGEKMMNVAEAGDGVWFAKFNPESFEGAEQSTQWHHQRFWIALCATLAAPGIKTADSIHKGKKLRRKLPGSAPLVTYRCVDIDLDKMAEIPGVAGRGDGGGPGMPLHHVRGHLRLTETKGLIPVRPHWRGSIANGVRRRDHNIMRNEELR